MSTTATKHGGKRPGAGRPKGSQATPAAHRESLLVARTRKESALADLRHLQLRKERGELIDVGLSKRVHQTLILNARAKFLSMPSRLAGELAAESSPVKCAEILRSAIDEALHELAAGKATDAA